MALVFEVLRGQRCPISDKAGQALSLRAGGAAALPAPFCSPDAIWLCEAHALNEVRAALEPRDLSRDGGASRFKSCRGNSQFLVNRMGSGLVIALRVQRVVINLFGADHLENLGCLAGSIPAPCNIFKGVI